MDYGTDLVCNPAQIRKISALDIFWILTRAEAGATSAAQPTRELRSNAVAPASTTHLSLTPVTCISRCLCMVKLLLHVSTRVVATVSAQLLPPYG